MLSHLKSRLLSKPREKHAMTKATWERLRDVASSADTTAVIAIMEDIDFKETPVNLSRLFQLVIDGEMNTDGSLCSEEEHTKRKNLVIFMSDIVPKDGGFEWRALTECKNKKRLKEWLMFILSLGYLPNPDDLRLPSTQSAEATIESIVAGQAHPYCFGLIPKGKYTKKSDSRFWE